MQYFDGDGIESHTPMGDITQQSWWQNLIDAGTQIATGAAQVKAAKEIAKTGQVPQAQLNVGLETNTARMVMIGGAVGLGALLLFMMTNRRRR